jgi:hypothetical protein
MIKIKTTESTRIKSKELAAAIQEVARIAWERVQVNQSLWEENHLS